MFTFVFTPDFIVLLFYDACTVEGKGINCMPTSFTCIHFLAKKMNGFLVLFVDCEKEFLLAKIGSKN